MKNIKKGENNMNIIINGLYKRTYNKNTKETKIILWVDLPEEKEYENEATYLIATIKDKTLKDMKLHWKKGDIENVILTDEDKEGLIVYMRAIGYSAEIEKISSSVLEKPINPYDLNYGGEKEQEWEFSL